LSNSRNNSNKWSNSNRDNSNNINIFTEEYSVEDIDSVSRNNDDYEEYIDNNSHKLSNNNDKKDTSNLTTTRTQYNTIKDMTNTNNSKLINDKS
jgi:hypothetical protein